MKRFFQDQYALFQELGINQNIRTFSKWFISLFISAYVLIILSIPLFETSGPRGQVFALDNDEGRAVEVSMATRWYNSNHFAPYGNLYYRFSHSLADLISVSSEDGLTPEENREKAHNFSLKLVSLLSVFSLGLFVGWILWGGSFVLPLFASAFTLLATDIPLWGQWIFRPHPDHLLILMVAIATFFFARHLAQVENKKWFIVSALCWGLAMAVKRSTAVFVPGILLVMLIPLNKESARRTLFYIGYMLTSYLIIGFPQNFGFMKHISFLLYESSLHHLGDWESISANSFQIYKQLFYLVPIGIGASFLSSSREKLISRKLLLFIVLSYVIFMARKMSFAGDQHTMPVAISTFVILLLGMLHLNRFRYTRHALVIVTIGCLAFIKLHGMSPVYLENRALQTKCLPEMKDLNTFLADKLSHERRLLKEPYFPFTARMEPFITTLWGLEWDKIDESVAFLGISRMSFETYAPVHPSNLYGKELDRLTEKKKFYQSLRDVSEVTSPGGLKFRKIISGNCGYDLWEKF